MRIPQASLIKFAGVGLVSTILDISCLKICLLLGVSTLIATAIGFLVGTINGYYLNSHLVFAQRRSYERYGKYLLISLGGLLLTELIIALLTVQTATLPVLGAKLVAVVLVFFWNYILSKVWAFK